MVPIYVAENPEISFAAKAVYISLKSHYPNIKCSIAHIMIQTGASKNTVKRAIHELEKWRLITALRSHRKVTEYKINLKSKPIKTEEYMREVKISWGQKLNPDGSKIDPNLGQKLNPN